MKLVAKITRKYYKREVVEYPEGIVVFESGNAGSYSITIEKNATIHLDMCGGGGNGYNPSWFSLRTGGSGAYIYGDTDIEKGTYTVIVGANGGNSSFLDNIAGGGGHAGSSNGAGGIATVVSSGLTGSNGSAGSTTSRIANRGGGHQGNGAGQVGYVKIVILSEETITPGTAEDYDFYEDISTISAVVNNNKLYAFDR